MGSIKPFSLWVCFLIQSQFNKMNCETQDNTTFLKDSGINMGWYSDLDSYRPILEVDMVFFFNMHTFVAFIN